MIQALTVITVKHSTVKGQPTLHLQAKAITRSTLVGVHEILNATQDVQINQSINYLSTSTTEPRQTLPVLRDSSLKQIFSLIRYVICIFWLLKILKNQNPFFVTNNISKI